MRRVVNQAVLAMRGGRRKRRGRLRMRRGGLRGGMLAVGYRDWRCKSGLDMSMGKERLKLLGK